MVDVRLDKAGNPVSAVLQGVAVYKLIDSSDIPSGEYPGEMNKKQVTFQVDDQPYMVEVCHGTLQTSKPCTVAVNENGVVTVKFDSFFDTI